MKAQPVIFPPNRVWRTYTGGAVLDRMEGCPAPTDDHWPEDWIASTTRARNPGKADPNGGLSVCRIWPEERFFRDLLREKPDYYLGKRHVAAYGTDPRILVKYLDAAVRLHIQAHPTAAFSRKYLGSEYGKAEAYYILSVRPDCHDPHVLIGFQRPPERDELRKWILDQDLKSLRAAFDPVPVRPGDCLHIPGGVPHAIGAGICMVELMEPSDWVVRCEFSHAGYSLPPDSRYLNGDPELSLACFDLTPRSVEKVREAFFASPRNPSVVGADARLEILINHEQTSAFRMRRLVANSPAVLPGGEGCVGLIAAGTAIVEGLACPFGSRLFFPAAGPEWEIIPGAEGCELLLCLPPLPADPP